MKPTRRSFIKNASAATAGAFIIPGLMSNAPSKRLNVAIIGVGGRGRANWMRLYDQKNEKWNENVVAVCDVDDNRAAEGYNFMSKAKRYKDFRVMFDEMHKKIDAVMISTPDHTHFPAAMAAMELGKHVIVEKPLAHNIWQLRTLQKAARHYGIVSQMANQGHATNGIRLVKEWYEAGLLGNVTEVIAWFDGPTFGPNKYFNKRIAGHQKSSRSLIILTGISGLVLPLTVLTMAFMHPKHGEAGLILAMVSLVTGVATRWMHRSGHWTWVCLMW